MESKTTRYLFDTNAIRTVAYSSLEARRSSNVALETTTDISYELGGRAAEKIELIKIRRLEKSAYTQMYKILDEHESVRALLDYCNNKGVGDLSVIAYALTVDEGKLMKDDTVIVTDDKPLKTACDKLGVQHISSHAFASL